MFFWLPVTLAPAWSRRVGTIGSAVESRPAEWVGHICGGAALATLRTAHPRLALGFQLDASAAVGPAFVLGGFAALQWRIKGAEGSRGERDAAVEALRAAQSDLLAGEATPDDVRVAARAALAAAAAYDDARRVAALPGALLRIPDPSAEQAGRILAPFDPSLQRERREAAARAAEGEGGGGGGGGSGGERGERRRDGNPEATLARVRGALGLRDSQPEQGARGSLLPSGSRRATVKDVLIGGALVLQICWFLLSLTDPLGGGGSQGGFLNRALSAGGEWVDQREAQRAAVDAEYRAMLQAERTATDAPPACATRKLDDPLGGCAGEAPLPKADPEFSRTRGLDATRGWISGSAANPSGL